MNNELIKDAADEYILNKGKISLTEVASKFKIKRQDLSVFLKSIGVKIENRQNKSRINENIFDCINTEEKAYWLGFIYADGCIYYSEKRFGMNLAIKDLDHMKKFAKFLEFTGNIGINKSYGYGLINDSEQCRISVRNKNLWEKLNSYGCTPRKSLTLKFPDESIFEDESLIRHFMRGYVDGDGCLTIVKDDREEVNVVGTYDFLDVFNKYLPIKEHKIKSKSTKSCVNNAFRINYACLKARKIARFLYENSNIYLDRKYDKYLKFCRLEEESSRKSSSKNGKS